MTFEEAVVAAIDFHGALTGTGSYAPPPEARGGKHKGARRRPIARLFLLRAGRRGQRGRRYRRSHRPQSLGRARLRTRAESCLRRRPDHRLGLDGHGPGAHRGNDLERWPADESWPARIPQPIVGRNRPKSKPSSSRASTPKAPSARKNAAKARWPRRFRRSANAIYDAVGIRLHESPFTPERVLAALRAKKNAKAVEPDRRRRSDCAETVSRARRRSGSKERARSGMRLDPVAARSAIAQSGVSDVSLPDSRLLRPRR